MTARNAVTTAAVGSVVIAMRVRPVPPSVSVFRRAVSPIAPIRTAVTMVAAAYVGNAAKGSSAMYR